MRSLQRNTVPNGRQSETFALCSRCYSRTSNTNAYITKKNSSSSNLPKPLPLCTSFLVPVVSHIASSEHLPRGWPLPQSTHPPPFTARCVAARLLQFPSRRFACSSNDLGPRPDQGPRLNSGRAKSIVHDDARDRPTADDHSSLHHCVASGTSSSLPSPLLG